jgi:1,4-dihydroxy-2-naphthoate octaprenyltransferase
MSLGLLLRAVRAPFLTASVVPILLGTALAWHDGSFDGLLFLLALLGGVAAQAGSNVINDYSDHVYGNDEANEAPTPFSRRSSSFLDAKRQSQAMRRSCSAVTWLLCWVPR